jgi:hypothetical protein
MPRGLRSRVFPAHNEKLPEPGCRVACIEVSGGLSVARPLR